MPKQSNKDYEASYCFVLLYNVLLAFLDFIRQSPYSLSWLSLAPFPGCIPKKIVCVVLECSGFTLRKGGNPTRQKRLILALFVVTLAA